MTASNILLTDLPNEVLEIIDREAQRQERSRVSTIRLLLAHAARLIERREARAAATDKEPTK